MGTLAGHLLPGTFFILFAIWWGFVTSIRYVQSRRINPTRNKFKNEFISSVTMPCLFLPCRKKPLESYLKASLAFVALLAEAYTGYKITYHKKSELIHQSNTTEHHHVHKRDNDLIPVRHFELGNAQHITIYSAFILGAIIEILIHYGVDLPKRLDYAMGVLAFSVEAFLFAFHLHGKEPIDAYVHILLVYAVIGCVVFSTLEGYNPKQVLFVYGRVLFTLLQGTWFYQVGFMLYPPTDDPTFQWDLNDHNNIMIVTVCFCWHVLLIVIGLLMQLWFVKRVVFKSNKYAYCLNSLRMIDDYNQGGKMSQDYLKLEKIEDKNLISRDLSSDEEIVIDLNNQNNRLSLS